MTTTYGLCSTRHELSHTDSNLPRNITRTARRVEVHHTKHLVPLVTLLHSVIQDPLDIDTKQSTCVRRGSDLESATVMQALYKIEPVTSGGSDGREGAATETS